MTDPTPLRYARPNQCRFCASRACRMRIYAEDGSFDEVSCVRHQDALCRHADRVAPGVSKLHSFSSGKQRRGEQPVAEEGFAHFRAEIAALEARA